MICGTVATGRGNSGKFGRRNETNGSAVDGIHPMSQPIEARLGVRADREAMSAARQFITAFAARAGIGGEDRARILITVEELVTNLVKYGYAPEAEPGSVEITLRLEDDRLSVEIVDDGQAFDPFSQPDPQLDDPLDDRPIGRLGLHLVKSLMDRTEYHRAGERNAVRVARRVILTERA